MVRGRTETGEIEVRVVLQVRIDRDAWALDVLSKEPEDVLDRDIRSSVKRYVRDRIGETLANVIAEGVYE